MDGFSLGFSVGFLSVWEISQYVLEALGRDDTLESFPLCAASLRLPLLHTANNLNWRGGGEKRETLNLLSLTNVSVQ